MNVRIVSEYKEATINNKKNLRIIIVIWKMWLIIFWQLSVLKKERYKIKFSSRSLNRK